MIEHEIRKEVWPFCEDGWIEGLRSEPMEAQFDWYEQAGDIFNESRLYGALGKEDARSVLGIWERFRKVCKRVREVTDSLGPEHDPQPSLYDRDHVGAVIGDTRRYTHWTALFWRLYMKSDLAHRARMAQAFPEHTRILEAWMLGNGHE